MNFSFNRTFQNFNKKEKSYELDNREDYFGIKKEKKDIEDIIQYYSKSSFKFKNEKTQEINNKHNLHCTFRKEIKSCKQRKMNEINNFHKNNLKENFKKNYIISGENSIDFNLHNVILENNHLKQEITKPSSFHNSNLDIYQNNINNIENNLNYNINSFKTMINFKSNSNLSEINNGTYSNNLIEEEINNDKNNIIVFNSYNTSENFNNKKNLNSKYYNTITTKFVTNDFNNFNNNQINKFKINKNLERIYNQNMLTKKISEIKKTSGSKNFAVLSSPNYTKTTSFTKFCNNTENLSNYNNNNLNNMININNKDLNNNLLYREIQFKCYSENINNNKTKEKNIPKNKINLKETLISSTPNFYKYTNKSRNHKLFDKNYIEENSQVINNDNFKELRKNNNLFNNQYNTSNTNFTNNVNSEISLNRNFYQSKDSNCSQHNKKSKSYMNKGNININDENKLKSNEGVENNEKNFVMANTKKTNKLKNGIFLEKIVNEKNLINYLKTNNIKRSVSLNSLNKNNVTDSSDSMFNYYNRDISSGENNSDEKNIESYNRLTDPGIVKNVKVLFRNLEEIKTKPKKNYDENIPYSSFELDNNSRNINKNYEINRNKTRNSPKIIIENNESNSNINEVDLKENLNNKNKNCNSRNFIHYYQSDLIDNYNKTYRHFNENQFLSDSETISHIEASNNNLDSNSNFKPFSSYQEIRGHKGIRSFVEKTKFYSKQNYYKKIQNEKIICTNEEYGNRIEEKKMELNHFNEFKKFFLKDFLFTFEKYARYCIRQKEKELQELSRIKTEISDTNIEIIKLERKKEKLFMEYTIVSEYKRFLLCVKYRISNKIFLKFFLKRGGLVQLKEEIKSTIKLDNLRKRNLVSINNLKINNNHSKGRRGTIFCSSSRTKNNTKSNNLFENDNKINIEFHNNGNNNKNSLFSFDFENIEMNSDEKKVNTYNKNNPTNINNNFSDFLEKITNKTENKTINKGNKNLVLLKNLNIEGIAIKSIPLMNIIDRKNSLKGCSIGLSIKNSSKFNDRNNTKDIEINKSPNIKESNNCLRFNKIYFDNKKSFESVKNDKFKRDVNKDLNNVIEEFSLNSKKNKNSSNTSKSKSVKNIINLFKEKSANDFFSNDGKKISDFSALVLSIKQLDKSKGKNHNNFSLSNSGEPFFNFMDNIKSSDKDLNNTNSISNINDINKNNSMIESSILTSKSKNNFCLRHYDQTLEFINNFSNQNEELKISMMNKNSKGYNLVNKFFYPKNKNEVDKEILLNRMYEEFNSKSYTIFKSIEEFTNILDEMKDRNIDLLNIYNKNNLVLKEFIAKKVYLEKNKVCDKDTSLKISNMEEILISEKERNTKLRLILNTYEEKFSKIKIGDNVFGKINLIFNNLKNIKERFNEKFIIHSELHSYSHIFESLQMFRIIEKCAENLINVMKIYNKEDKYKIELFKILKKIEHEKKKILNQKEKEESEVKKKMSLINYTDKCFKSDIYYFKRKIMNRYNFERKKEDIDNNPQNRMFHEFKESLENEEYFN